MQITGDYLVDFGVPLSIILSVVIGITNKSFASKIILVAGGLLFFGAYISVLIFGNDCVGHPGIGYKRCSSFSGAVADIASSFNAFAIFAYVFLAAPLFLVALILDFRFRSAER